MLAVIMLRYVVFKAVISIVDFKMWRIYGYSDHVDFDNGCSMQLSVFELVSIDHM